MSKQNNSNDRPVASAASVSCPGFTSIWEWIDYWCAGNAQYQEDKLSADEMRADLAWASQTINHLLASLRDIYDCPLEAKPNYADAVRIAKNAIGEYGIK